MNSDMSAQIRRGRLSCSLPSLCSTQKFDHSVKICRHPVQICRLHQLLALVSTGSDVAPHLIRYLEAPVCTARIDCSILNASLTSVMFYLP